MTSRSHRIPGVSLTRATRPALLILAGLLASDSASAQTLDLNWHTIDGGGATFSTGGTFQVGGTIGQPDASSFTTPMSGGTFSLVGGFWPVAGQVCTLPGDMNLDGARDGEDVQLFVNCVLSINGANCACADLDGGGVSASDVPQFVAALLGA